MSDPATTLKIHRVGHRGDGETDDGIFVPFTLAGEEVEIEAAGDRGRLINVVTPSSDRVEPRCRHFGLCGGCALQHMETKTYAAWKRDQVIAALAQRGLTDIDVRPLVEIGPATRRRATFSMRRTRDGVVLGFQERHSHFIVDVEDCPILHPELLALLPKWRDALADELPERGQTEISLTLARNGIDVTIGLPSIELDPKRRTRLANLAQQLHLTRLTVNGELVAQVTPPSLEWGGVAVQFPPSAFLQASSEAEQIMQTQVSEMLARSKKIADLFCGCGAFSLPLARKTSVSAYDSDQDATTALSLAARSAQGLKPVTVERRDLFRRPLLKHELDKFDAVVIDPPRAGARAQCEQLANSKVETIAAVSCNPATFARDARTLIDGGYVLRHVTPIDQFLWSAHIELTALFERN